MYSPKHFTSHNIDDLLEFIQEYSFGVLVLSHQEKPIASHLPFHIDYSDGKITISGHVSKANEIWKMADDKDVLVIFSGPHAFISPKHYDAKESVPTWDYIAAHCYGKLKLLDQDEAVLQKMFAKYSPEYSEQWNSLSSEYKEGMKNAIQSFEIKVTSWQLQEKLSQNKNHSEKERIRDHLRSSEKQYEKEIAKKIKP